MGTHPIKISGVSGDTGHANTSKSPAIQLSRRGDILFKARIFSGKVASSRKRSRVTVVELLLKKTGKIWQN